MADAISSRRCVRIISMIASMNFIIIGIFAPEKGLHTMAPPVFVMFVLHFSTLSNVLLEWLLWCIMFRTPKTAATDQPQRQRRCVIRTHTHPKTGLVRILKHNFQEKRCGLFLFVFAIPLKNLGAFKGSYIVYRLEAVCLADLIANMRQTSGSDLSLRFYRYRSIYVMIMTLFFGLKWSIHMS